MLSPLHGIRYLFIVGGWQSGRAPGFLRLRSFWTPNYVRLDGRQSCAVSLHATTDSGEPPDRPVRIRAKGMLKFREGGQGAKSTSDAQSDGSQLAAASLLDDQISIYSVLFSTTEVYTNEYGKAVVTLLPRADDILEAFDELLKRLGIEGEEAEKLKEQFNDNQLATDTTLKINQDEERFPYKVVAELTVIDEFYYGQTIEEIKTAREQAEQTDATEVGEGTASEDEPKKTKRLPKLDENGDPVVDADGNILFEEVEDPCLSLEDKDKDKGKDKGKDEDKEENLPDGNVVRQEDVELCTKSVRVPVSVDWSSVSRGASTEGIEGVGEDQDGRQGGNAVNSDGSSGGSGSSGEAGVGAPKQEKRPELPENKPASSTGGGILASQKEASASQFTFSLEPPPFRQDTSPEIQYYNNIGWVPTIKTIVGGNAGEAEQILARLENLRNEIPFGASAVYDALVIAAKILSDDDVDNKRKALYLFTDNEANLSRNSLDEAIEDVNAIDGEEEVPAVVGNFAVVKPVTLFRLG